MIAKIRTLFWLGVIMLFLPFFGVPNTWKTIGAILIGVIVLWLAVGIRRNYKGMKLKLRRFEQLSEESLEHHE